MTDWATLFRDWFTPIIAVTGLGLSVWTRIDKWREDRKKEAEALPWARLKFVEQEKVESDSHSVRAMVVEFNNPTRNRWKATRAKLLEPAAASIRKRGRPDTWERALDLDWAVTSVAERGEERSHGYLELRFERQPATGEPGPLRDVAVEVTLQEVSAKRRRHKVDARLTQHF